MQGLYCNEFEVAFSEKEQVFYLTFKFSNGEEAESVSVVIIPQGAKTLSEALTLKVKEFEKKVRNITLWKKTEPKNSDTRYIS